MKSTGAYVIYPLQVQIMEKHKWCTLDSLMDFVNNHRYSGFHCSVHHVTIRNAYGRLGSEVLFGEHYRFLCDDFYVHLDNPNISKAIMLILTGLDVPQELLDINIVRNPSYFDIIKYISDAKKSFHDGFTELHKLITVTDKESMKSNGIYCRETFEAQFNLTWE